MTRFTVSELARRAEATPDTVRYYERIGLLPRAERSASGYRLFGDEDVERMRFIARAQRFGLHLHDIRQLLEIRERGLCPCGHAHELLGRKLEQIEAEIASLRDSATTSARCSTTGESPAEAVGRATRDSSASKKGEVMAMNAAEPSSAAACTCGCGLVTEPTRVEEPCGCGCWCCAAEPVSKERPTELNATERGHEGVRRCA